ncbi:DUF2512 family protein [Salinibacillus xinjiangensis]|nr:DUF2512 family protein [Salinibacillus xinjiangensis]
MRHIMAFGIKYLVITIAVLSVFSAFTNPTIIGMLGISALIVALGYFMGDLLILRKFGNLMATLADFGLAFLVLFFYGIALNIPTGQVGTAALFAAFFIAIAEGLFHFFMENRVFRDPTYTDEDRYHVHQVSSSKLQTETSDEVFPYDVKRKNKQQQKDKEER